MKNCVKEFCFGKETVEDIGHDGRSVKVPTPETIALMEEEPMTDLSLKSRKKLRGLFLLNKLSNSTVRRILYDHLHISQLSTRGIPKFLSAVQK